MRTRHAAFRAEFLRFAAAAVFVCFTLLAAAAPTFAQQTKAAAPQADTVTITVQPGARQTFAGLGVSLGNWGRDYQKLTAGERERLSRFLWGGLKLKSLRLWLNLNEYAPTPGERLTNEFRERYITSGIIADAKKHGVTELLLAPDNAPDFMKTKREGGAQDFALRDDRIADYADLIAEFIAQIRRETGVLINVTGVQNEPNDLDRITPAQFPAVVKALRAALDRRGLKTVKIITPESANVDGVLYETLDRLKADPAAWNALAGISSHSYSMAATDEAARRIAGSSGGPNTKTYWMTEASANGPEVPGDTLRAASLASRFLSDMNHRTTHWIHFLGFEIPDPNDNATRILAFTPRPLRMTVFQKYHYYQQMMNTFAVGAVFRDSQSSREGDMTWTYGKKPRITAAAARNPDGSWGVGISNFTAPSFNDDPNDVSGSDNGYKARAFTVTVSLPELATAAPNTVFTVHRSQPSGARKPEGTLPLRNGSITVTVAPLELVTLRSQARKK